MKTLKTPVLAPGQKRTRRARNPVFKPTSETLLGTSIGILSDDDATNAACVALGQDPVFQAGLMRAFALSEALQARRSDQESREEHNHE